MAKFKRVLIAVRRDETGLPLAAVNARYLAQRLGAALTLVSCVYDSEVAVRLSRADAAAGAAQAGMIRNEERDLERLAQSLREWGAQVDTRVVWDQPVYAGLVRAVQECGADLLVIGAHETRLGIPHTRLTATDWQIMRLAPCPVLLVKQPGFEGYGRILATIDPLHSHSEPSGLDHATLAVARELARALDAELSVAHAFPDPAAFALASAVEVLPGVFYGTENIESVHRQAALELATAHGIGPDALDVRPGPPAEVIAAVAVERRTELVVIGAVRRSALEQAVLGSTAEAVAAELACDVLLVPAPRS